MQQESSGYPRVTAGRNIVVEELQDGYRVSARPDPADTYRGFFQVRPYPSFSPGSPDRVVQVANGILPYERSLTESAGYVSIDRLHWIPDDKGGPAVGSRRMRFPVPPAASLSVPDGVNTVFLKITAHSGGSDTDLKFKEAGNRTVYFRHNYLLAPEVPELKEGVIYFPLAEVESDATGTFHVTQLSAGEPSGVIMQYYGSDTLELSDSGESSSSSGGGSSSSGSSSSDGGSSSSNSSKSGSDASSSSAESSASGSHSSSSGTNSSSSGAHESSSAEPSASSDSSGGTPAESSSGDEPEGSGSGSGGGGGGGGSHSGGGGVYDPNLWYIVADCIRYICHPSLGIANYSGTTSYYAAKGDAIAFEAEPAAPTATKPISEWLGVVMIEGPYEDRLSVPQSRIDELNNLNVGDPC